MFYPESKAQWRVLLLALCLIFFSPLALSADDPGLDTDGDGLTNDVDLDDDGDGVPDIDDIAPLEAGVSTFTPTTTEDVEGARLVQTAPGSIANPSFQLGQNKGATFSFAGGGTGEYTNRSGSFPVTWSVNGNGSLAIDLLPESDDASSGFFFASQLVELGLATTESANAFVASNGDLQIEVLTVGDSETWYLLDDQDNIRVWVNGTSSASIVDDNFRQQLRGDINASPVTIEFSGERTYLDLSERALGTIDLGLGTPWGADAVLLTTSVIPGEIPGRRFNAEIVDFQANGTGTLRRTGTAVTWQFPAPDSLEISIPSTGAQVLVRQLESFTDSFGLYSVGTLGDESYTDYGLGVIVTSTSAVLTSYTDQFLLGSFQVTDPDTRDEDGNYVLSSLFGFRLNADGTADQVNSAEPGAPLVNRWFWQEDSSTGEIVLRAHVDQSGDSWRFFSDCDPGVSPQTCVVFRERHWIPVALASDRMYVQEFELRPVDLNPGTSEQSLAIAPRAVFYERYTQDLDGDQVNDVAEVLSGADPLVADDADGDGVPDLLDAAPEDASVGAFEPILLEEVTGARVIETMTSAIADPSISLAQFKGQTYEFDEGGSGTYISGDGSIPFTWSLDARGVLQIDMNSDPADAILSFRLVSDLPSLGLATQSAADAYIQNFGNLQIGVLSRPVTEFIYSLYDDNNPFQLYRRSINELSLQNANDREQLQGDINASPVANESGGTSYFLDLEETPVLSANTGADTPWGITNLLTHVAIDPSATQSRRFGADVIEFAAGGTGVLQASGESITWQYDASGGVIVDVPTTGSQIVLTQLNQYSDSLGIYAVGTRDGESYALYSLGVPVVPGSTDPAVVASFLDQFLVSAFSVTDPNTRDESGNIRLGTVFGYQLNTDGTARRVLSADPNQPANDLWFWEQTLAGDILLTARMDQSGQQSQAYSACDPALPTCFVFRERYWTPISYTQSRLYMNEREFLTQTYDAADPQLALSIAPRPNFYEFYTQDLDGDGLNDMRESIAQLNPLVPESDFDGDGIIDLLDPDDDNDGVPDVEDVDPFNPDLPAAGPNSRLKNLATRGFVGTGDNVLIGGLIITGTEPKTVVIRARGPALADAGVTGALADPEVALFSGATVIDSNDNWETHPGVDLIPEDLKPTAYPNEAVIATTLAPGAYTAIVGGKDGSTGIGLVEIFEVSDTGVTRLQNIATRGFVDTGDGVLIGGLVISGSEPKKVVIRAKGPSLTEQGVPGALANPRIAIFSGASVIKTNDSWDSEDNLDKEKIPLDLRPTNSLEATVYMELAPGPYTAIVDGSDGGTGVGIVEVFEVLD